MTSFLDSVTTCLTSRNDPDNVGGQHSLQGEVAAHWICVLAGPVLDGVGLTTKLLAAADDCDMLFK
jgi:hypothetical protein